MALLVGKPFNSFPGVAHGGYVGGLASPLVGPETELRFLRPIRPGVALHALPLPDGAVGLFAEGTPVAELRAGGPTIEAPAPPSLAEARASAAGGPPFEHPFPGSFVWREEGGLGLRVGRVPDGDLVAGTWRPPVIPKRTPAPIAWALLDDAGFWGATLDPPAGVSHVVSARMRVRLAGRLRAGEEHVITAWPAGASGRGMLAGSAIHRADGTLIALMEQLLLPAKWGFPMHECAGIAA